jgi:hypothetical protein
MSPYFIVTASFLKQNENEMSWFIDPIPLNTNWLEKFGFKAWDDKKTIYTLERHIDKYNNTCFRFWLQLDKLVFDYIQNEIHPTESIFDDKNIIRLEVKYVHQLQNLYFALTGEELTVEL